MMNKKLNITMVVDTYGVTTNGTTITAMRMTEALRKRGHKVYVLTGSHSDCKDTYSTGYNKLPFLYQISKSQGMLIAKSNKETIQKVVSKSDIVHFLLPFKLGKETKKIADELNVSTTAAFHVQPENITSSFRLNNIQTINKMIYSSFRKFYDRFTHVHCPSHMIANALKENGYSSKLHVFSNGVDPVFYPQDIEKPVSLKDKFVILMIGRLSREKRQDLIINAIKNLPMEKDVQLILAGKGPWKKFLEKEAMKLTNKPIMKFFDQSELVKVINYSDLYIHAADYEIEAISCIEAFSCGLVPIISDSVNSATNQFALSSHNLFKANDYIDLSHKIMSLFNDRELKEKLSSDYLDYARQFRLETSVDSIEEMFYEILENRQTKK